MDDRLLVQPEGIKHIIVVDYLNKKSGKFKNIKNKMIKRKEWEVQISGFRGDGDAFGIAVSPKKL